MTMEELCIKACEHAIGEQIRNKSTMCMVSTRESCYRIEWLEVMDYLDKLKQEPKTREWISVHKALPEDEVDVLVCSNTGNIEVARGSCSTEIEGEFIWYTSGWIFGKVIAWMPLPEPYKEDN